MMGSFKDVSKSRSCFDFSNCCRRSFAFIVHFNQFGMMIGVCSRVGVGVGVGVVVQYEVVGLSQGIITKQCKRRMIL